MKALITGADGFIGTNLFNYLVKGGWEVIRHTRQWYGDIIDINDHKVLLKGVDVVFHLASTIHNYHILDEEESYIDVDTNCRGTISLLNAMKTECPKAKMVYVSTFFVNKGEPKGLYGATKLCAEHICKAYSRVYGIKCSIARLSNVYGRKHVNMDSKAGAFDKMLQIIKKDGWVDLYEENPRRDFIHVDDVVTALEVLAKKGKDRQVYDVATGHSEELEKLIGIAIRIAGKGKYNLVASPLFHKQVGLNDCLFDIEPLLDLGWKCKLTIIKGIRECFK